MGKGARTPVTHLCLTTHKVPNGFHGAQFENPLFGPTSSLLGPAWIGAPAKLSPHLQPPSFQIVPWSMSCLRLGPSPQKEVALAPSSGLIRGPSSDTWTPGHDLAPTLLAVNQYSHCKVQRTEIARVPFSPFFLVTAKSLIRLQTHIPHGLCILRSKPFSLSTQF